MKKRHDSLVHGVCVANSEAKSRRLLAGFAALMIAAIFTLAGCDWGGGDDGGDPIPHVEVAVTGLTNMPDTAYVNAEMDLSSVTVSPANADRKTIVWSVKDADSTGVTAVVNNRFTPTAAGTLALTATVAGGKADGTDFISDQTITVKAEDRKALSGTVTITTNAIKGVTLQGVNLENTLTNVAGAPVYHWQRSAASDSADSEWKDIEGAVGLTYTLGNDDVNQYIRLKVSYSGASGFVASNVAGPVAATLPAVWKPEPSINVSDASTWQSLLTTIAAGNVISLDLSECAMTGTEFNPGTNNTGESKILSLVLPNVAKSIKPGDSDQTFKNFTVLTSISGANITEIGDNAFQNCTALTTVNFPKAETIGEWAFYGCAALTDLSLPAVTNLDQFAFGQCVALKTVSLPKAETIGLWAFSYNTALTMANFPKAETIGDNAFAHTALTSVSLPATLTTLGDAVFIGCANLTTITVDPGNTVYKAQNGMLLNHAGDTLVAYPSASGEITLNAAITTIGDYAFSENTALTAVNAPEVQDIGGYAFYDNTALITVNFPKAETIGGMSFLGCATLTSVSLPAAETINAYAFEKCVALESVSLPLATSIPTCGFNSCTALTTVNFPKATIIGISAFYGCTALESVSIPSATNFRQYVFEQAGVKDLTVTLGLTAPELRYMLFARSAGRNVTVKVPANATGYVPNGTTLPVTYSGDAGAAVWGNGFRGGGGAITDGEGAFPTTNGGANYINRDITLTIEAIEEHNH